MLRKSFYAFALLGMFSVSSAQAAAVAQSFTIVPTVSQEDSGATKLHLLIKDSQPKSGVCPYYVKSLSYLPAVTVLNVQIYQETCLNDRYGQSSGDVYWIVPNSLVTEGGSLKIIVNDSSYSSLAYDVQAKTFSVKK